MKLEEEKYWSLSSSSDRVKKPSPDPYGLPSPFIKNEEGVPTIVSFLHASVTVTCFRHTQA